MRLNKEEIQRIAKLSRISLTLEEESLMVSQLSAVVDYFQEIAALDTSGVGEDFADSKDSNRLRPDEPRDSGIQEAILSLVPMREDNFIKVKSIL